MFAAALSAVWSRAPRAVETTRTPPRRRPAPVFIGDAVQPWQGETLLLAVLRAGTEDDPGRNG